MALEKGNNYIINQLKNEQSQRGVGKPGFIRRITSDPVSYSLEGFIRRITSDPVSYSPEGFITRITSDPVSYSPEGFIRKITNSR